MGMVQHIKYIQHSSTVSLDLILLCRVFNSTIHTNLILQLVSYCMMISSCTDVLEWTVTAESGIWCWIYQSTGRQIWKTTYHIRERLSWLAWCTYPVCLVVRPSPYSASNWLCPSRHFRHLLNAGVCWGMILTAATN